MTRILVTGGAGYIGSHTCAALAEHGFEPVVFDDLSTGHGWAVQWGPLEVGTLLERDRIHAVVEHYRPAATIHFASSAYVGESVAAPALYWRNNVVGAVNLLDALVAGGAAPLVFSSSCTVYGTTSAGRIGEAEPLGPLNPYGNTKRAIEIMLADYAQAYGLAHFVLRYFNAAGCDAAGRTGEVHDPETHLIPLALAAARGVGAPLRIFGTDYATPDGTCVRDYVHVTDLADAHVCALQSLLDGGASNTVNLGSGRGFSVREVIDAAGRAVGRPARAIEAERRAGDPARLVADISAAKSLLGWVPRHSSLDNIVGTAWRWLESR